MVLLPCHHIDRTYHSLQLLTLGSRSQEELTEITSYIVRSFGYEFMLSSRGRTGILTFKVFHEAVSKRWVATSSILTRSVYHSRKNTYQDNSSRAPKTIQKTSRLHNHTTRKIPTPRETIMAPKQKIIIDTDPVCHFTNFKYQHPGQHIL